MSMESLPFLGFRVLGVDTKNSNPKFTGEHHTFHYTFLFDAYAPTNIFRQKYVYIVYKNAIIQKNHGVLSVFMYCF